ncbi:hypothetical protein R3I93_016818 [Phoxinus phoxinus]|uniref:DUF4614 domain-containing protein n=1 Tax=Phoxinus phoxinus TaxID=58324 RepID=A0AAN9CH11_9TELE
MGSRGGLRSSALDRAKAHLSGHRISNTAISADKRDVEKSAKFKSLTRPDLSDIPASPRENQDHAKSFIIGGGSRFLKKTSKNATEDTQPSAPSGPPAEMDEFKFIPQRSSQSTALSRLALIENRIRNQKGDHTRLSEPQETRLSVQSSSDLSTTGTRFLKKTLSAPPEERVPERTPGLDEYKVRRVSLDSDEQDMRRLLGDSFSLSESSLQNAARKTSPQPVKKLYKKSSECSPTPERHKVLHHRSVSPSPSRPESRMIRSVSSASDHSEIRSLDDLFPVDSDDTLSERSAVLDDFKLNVMTLDDLAPIPFEISQEKKETKARKEDRNKKSSNNIPKLASPPTPREASAAYESDFESEIPSETPSSASEISERLTDGAKDASLASELQYSSYKSQVDDNDDDRTLSQSSLSSSRHSDSSSRSSSSNATVTHGPSPERHVKEVAVQTQMDRFAYTWSSGMAAVGPSLGMTYVDPTPIANHTVSAEAIESLTAYNPAVVALNDMLRQQLALTRSFIESTRRHYNSVHESLGSADYKYTTLQDTKEFIRAHRPPKLSIEDALEEVLQEMQDYHYM